MNSFENILFKFKQLKSHKRFNGMLISILIIFHTVGIVGLYSDSRPYFLSLSPMNLILSFAILCLARKTNLSKFLIFCFVALIYGIGIELIGIHTELLFGSYDYGNSLGVKFFDVPIVIGINWAVLVACTAEITGFFKLPKFVAIAFASLLMTLLDVLIEPVAMKSDYWSWENNVIPLYNFVCWFACAIPLQYLYEKLKLKEQNLVAISLFLILTVFFTILNVF